ncbi:hypothetical protein AVEN_182138-1 [Araneus ventricosus]|uniref:Uncharacterized protein n=1 Tax=Araneus ventricosus TaxID=182803 RepID=A0A4Y2GQU4_ARAVE|nr:hypothetical protein AVEN_182138-1 [Araneus ventricosus]
MVNLHLHRYSAFYFLNLLNSFEMLHSHRWPSSGNLTHRETVTFFPKYGPPPSATHYRLNVPPLKTTVILEKKRTISPLSAPVHCLVLQETSGFASFRTGSRES